MPTDTSRETMLDPNAFPSLLLGVVIFEPTPDELMNVRRLRSLHQMVAVFDNSTTVATRSHNSFVCQMHGIHYEGSATNNGTAAGLNSLLRYAESQRCQWLLYFDQDSVPTEDYVEVTVRHLARYARERAAVVGSTVINHSPTHQVDDIKQQDLEEVRYIPASGMCINVKVACGLGGFSEKLGLDTVDIDFCMKARHGGFDVLVDKSRILYHSYGEATNRPAKFLGRPLYRYPLWRRELMGRNSAILLREHFVSFPLESLKFVVGGFVMTMACACNERRADVVRVFLRGFVRALYVKTVRPPELGQKV